MSKTKAEQTATAKVTLRGDELIEEIDRLAQAEKRSRQAQACVLIEEALRARAARAAQ